GGDDERGDTDPQPAGPESGGADGGGPGRGRRGHGSYDAVASTIARRRSTTRGPQRDATSSSSSTTRPSRTAVRSAKPGRAASVSAFWPQHGASARKMKSGSASTRNSRDSCG